MRKSIAVDMDGVIADVEAQFLAWYERDFGIKKHRDEMKGFSEDNAFSEPGLIRKYATTAGFFLTVPVMQDAVESIQELMKYFEVYIVSAAMEFPLSLTEKLTWLKTHFPFIHWKNIIFCGDKSIINTDIMIDDHIKNLDYFKGETIMFDAFHNVSYNHHTRVHNWKEVLALLQAHR